MHNVSFRYSEYTPEVLHRVSVEIQAGQKVAIVGRTGSGKSTLGKLLLGLYLPTQGEIFYDNVPLQTLDYQAVRAKRGRSHTQKVPGIMPLRSRSASHPCEPHHMMAP